MILWLVIALAICFAAGALLGAPYVPLLKVQVEPMLKVLDLKSGQTLVDLGCGDGRLLKAAAKQGVKGIGYEINPLLWVAAKLNCYKYKGMINIRLGNFWQADLPKANAVFVFLITRYMTKLDCYLEAQIKSPTKVVCYVYKIPGRKAVKTGSNFSVYLYP